MKYLRHETFKYLSKEEVDFLRSKTVAVCGLGSIGSKVASLLARAGINLILIDRGVVRESNITTHELLDEKDVDLPKVFAISKKLVEINKDIRITPYFESINSANVEFLLKNADVIVDGLDNMISRYILNDYSRKNSVPFVHAAIAGNTGVVLNVVSNDTACFQCLYPEALVGDALDKHESEGTLNSFSNILSGIVATECIKILLGKDYMTNLLYVKFWTNDFEKIGVEKDPNCKACSGNFAYLSMNPSLIEVCGDSLYFVDMKGINFENLVENVKNKLELLTVNDYLVKYNAEGKLIYVFKDGRAIIQANSKEEAIHLYNTYVKDLSEKELNVSQVEEENTTLYNERREEEKQEAYVVEETRQGIYEEEDKESEGENKSEEEDDSLFFPQSF